AVLDEIVGLQRHVKGQVLLHVGGDFCAFQSRAVAAGEFPGEGLNVVIQLFFENHLGDKADALGFYTGKIPSRERDVKGLLDRNTSVKKRRRGGGAVAAANDLWHAELRGIG